MPTDEGRFDASDITKPIKLTDSTLSTSEPIEMKVLPKSELGWISVLSPDEFEILRNKGTEAPGHSERTPGALEYELKKEFKVRSGPFSSALPPLPADPRKNRPSTRLLACTRVQRAGPNYIMQKPNS